MLYLSANMRKIVQRTAHAQQLHLYILAHSKNGAKQNEKMARQLVATPLFQIPAHIHILAW